MLMKGLGMEAGHQKDPPWNLRAVFWTICCQPDLLLRKEKGTKDWV
jgi:hypothetical protein